MGDKQASCVVVGPFPPPVTGAAKNTQNIYEALIAGGVRASRINTAIGGASGHARWRYHLRRALQNAGAIFALMAEFVKHRKSAIYIVPDAGLGMYYTAIHAMVAGCLFPKLAFHHRSYFYISAPTRVMQFLTNVTRAKSLHVFLSPGMAEGFQARYGQVRNMVAANACFISGALEIPIEADRARWSDDVIRLGHLSNLRRNKGFYLVTEVFEALVDLEIPVELHLAGPATEDGVQDRIDALRLKYGAAIHHAGPLSGDAKIEFYRNIDVFLFPTLHPQEAQPNVVYEALAAGVAVLATPRACIPEMLDGRNGEVSPDEANFVDFAVKAIGNGVGKPWLGFQPPESIRDEISVECAVSKKQYRQLLSELGVANQTAVTTTWLN